MCWSSGSAAHHRPRGGAKRPFHLLLHCMGPVVEQSGRNISDRFLVRNRYHCGRAARCSNFFRGGGSMRSLDLLCAASHRPPRLRPDG
jgi:hypothetical protein